MASESKVRIAGVADYQEIWRMFLQSHNENGLFRLSPQKVEWLICRILAPQFIPPEDTGPRGVIGVIGKVGALEAICGICISDIWYTDEKHLSDFLVFVDPEFRKSDHATALVNWMKQQSDIIGLPFISGVVSNHRTEAKCRMYRRMMPKIGEYFFYPKSSDSMH